MKTVVLNEPGQFEITDTPLPPKPSLNEVQVRIRRVGICGTDLHAYTGTQPFFNYPRILGHELAVEITQLGDTTRNQNLKIGDLCCVRPYMNCGTCDACRRGFTNACNSLQVLGVHRDGGMREFINLPIDKLHLAPGLSADELATVEMLSIGCHAVRRASLNPNEHILIIGLGPIGLGVAQFAHLAGVHVIAMDISDSRLAFARQQKAIHTLIDGRNDPIEQLKALIPDGLPTVVFDATGNAASMMKSFSYVAHGGRLVFVGLFQGDVTFKDPEFHRREMSLLASRNATVEDFDKVIAALQSCSIDIKPWITPSPSPEQMIRDFPHWLDPANGVVKAMFTFD